MRSFAFRRCLFAVPVIAAGVALTACGTVVGTSAPVASSSAEPSMNLYGAPRVAHPLDVTKFLKDPCSVIPSDQLHQLATKYSLGTKSTPNNSPVALSECQYASPNLDPNASQANVGFLKGGAGLAGAYASRNSDSTFKEMTVLGYPAINTVINGDSGGCNITVGVTDRQAVDVEYDPADSSLPQSQTCPAAQAMATVVVQTIKAHQ